MPNSRPPSRSQTGIGPALGIRQTLSFKIRAQNKRKPTLPMNNPPLELVEEKVSSYDLTTEVLRVWLEDRFPGYEFDGEKIKLQFDKYVFWVPETLTEDERSEITALQEVQEQPPQQSTSS